MTPLYSAAAATLDKLPPRKRRILRYALGLLIDQIDTQQDFVFDHGMNRPSATEIAELAELLGLDENQDTTGRSTVTCPSCDGLMVHHYPTGEEYPCPLCCGNGHLTPEHLEEHYRDEAEQAAAEIAAERAIPQDQVW
jgi:hypothetical protein